MLRLAPLVLALACSGQSGGDSVGEDGGGAASIAGGGAQPGSAGALGSAGTPGSAGFGATAGGASGAGGGATAGNGASGAAGAVSPLELDPIAVGNVWAYAVVVSSPTADCSSGLGKREVTAALEYQGRSAFETHRFCDPDATYLNVSDGQIWQYLDGWYRNVAAPVADGATWAFAPGYTLKWSSVGSVTVLAGTFQNCWKRSVVEFEGSITFCPGVGQVRIELPNLTAQLSDYHLE
jgi:hypothetical protein